LAVFLAFTAASASTACSQANIPRAIAPIHAALDELHFMVESLALFNTRPRKHARRIAQEQMNLLKKIDEP
jgi:uncharacterized protein (UPF0212 family)